MTKISKNLLLFFSIATAVIYFSSCEKHTYEIKPPEVNPDILFSQDIQPVFDAKCVSCHRGSQVPDLRPENSYRALSDGGYLKSPVEESVLYKYVFVETSHSAFTNQEEKNKIFSWISLGAEDN